MKLKAVGTTVTASVDRSCLKNENKNILNLKGNKNTQKGPNVPQGNIRDFAEQYYDRELDNTFDLPISKSPSTVSGSEKQRDKSRIILSPSGTWCEALCEPTSPFQVYLVADSKKQTKICSILLCTCVVAGVTRAIVDCDCGNHSISENLFKLVGFVFIPELPKEINLVTCEHSKTALYMYMNTFRHSMIFEGNKELEKLLISYLGTNKPKNVLNVYVSPTVYRNMGQPLLTIANDRSRGIIWWHKKTFFCHACPGSCNNPCNHLRMFRKATGDDKSYENLLIRKSSSLRKQNDSLFLMEEYNNFSDMEDAIAAKRNLAEENFNRQFVDLQHTFRHTDELLTAAMVMRTLNFRDWLNLATKYDAVSDKQVMRCSAVICSHCKTPLSSGLKTEQAVLIAQAVYRVIIPSVVCLSVSCPEANKELNYPFFQLGLFRQGNRLILTAELVFEYLNSSAEGATSVSCWWGSKVDTYLRMNCMLAKGFSLNSLMSMRGLIANAMVGVSEMLEDAETFKCCLNPRAISLDGIVLSVKREKFPEISTPWLLEKTVRMRATMQHERQFPRLTTAQVNCLFLLCNHQKGLPERSLQQALSENEAPRPYMLLLMLADQHPKNRTVYVLHSSLEAFAEMMLKDIAPLCSLVNFAMLETLKELSIKKEKANLETRIAIQRNSPILYQVYLQVLESKGLPQKKALLWKFFESVVNEIVQKVQATYNHNKEEQYKLLIKEEMEEIRQSFQRRHPQNSDFNELWSTGCYFPHHPICRKISKVEIGSSFTTSIVCNKKTTQDNRCAPGVVLFYCEEHQKCIGFLVLDKHESPRQVFELIATRFQNLPQFVLYDNACNLSEYVLNRAPKLFQNTTFLVDPFHYASHKNCSPSFNAREIPFYSKQWNTSLFEQRNSRLGKLKALTPLYTARSYFALLRNAVSKHNSNYDAKRELDYQMNQE